MKQIGEYIIIQPDIAKGAFASIHKGEHKYSRIPVAIKEIKVNDVKNLKKYVIRELEIHKKLNHPNIVKIYDIIIKDDINTIFMIMEYCGYGDLQKFQNKKPLCEKYIQQYMIQLRDALKYLYDNNIVHRDLKPQNILLINPLQIKITDFGLARHTTTKQNDNIASNDISAILDKEFAEQDLFSTYCGSPIYMSPELLNKQNYNSKSDLWSVGVILYELITGYPPYIAKNITQLINKVNYEPVNLDNIMTSNNDISPDCFDLLKQLLNTNKHSRMNWNSFFNHKWFSPDKNILITDENILLENPLDYNLINKMNNSIFKDPSSVNSSINTSNEKLKFSDTLQINKQSNQSNQSSIEKYQNTKPINSIKKKFTYSLKSSLFINESECDNINISDLEQDDLPPITSNNTSTKPITINKPQNSYNYRKELSSTNSSNTPTSTSKSQSIKQSPSSLTHALNIITETYNYLSNNKTI